MMDSFAAADDLLADFHVESMQHLLTSFRVESEWTERQSQLHNMDSVVDSACTIRIPTVSRSNVDRHTFLGRGDVVEIQGPAASGKSRLLLHLLATCILPSQYGNVDIGGWGRAAVLFDTDHGFNVQTLRGILLCRLSAIQEAEKGRPNLDFSDLAVEALVTQCLARLHVFHPTSSIQLAESLLDLPRYHLANSSLSSYEIGMLAIDSLGAFYWTDRFAVEQLRDAIGHPGFKNPVPIEPASPLRQVLTALRKFRDISGPVTVFTNWGLKPLNISPDAEDHLPPLYKQHLHLVPSPFTLVYPGHPLAWSSSPAVDAGASLSSKNWIRHDVAPGNGTQHLIVLPDSTVTQEFSLTHHITLAPPSAKPSFESFTTTEVAAGESTTASLVRGLAITIASSNAARFVFQVTDDDIIMGCGATHASPQ